MTNQAVVPDASADAVPLAELGPVHFIGIGGAGMSAIARIMLARGVVVSGSDAHPGPVLDSLAAQGASVFAGHKAEQVPTAGSVVVTSAVRADNPELVAAQSAGLRVLHRSEALASLMLGHRAVAVAGTHGKTTTTGMITTVLRATGLDPSFAIGGQLTGSGVGAGEGSGDIFVAEADESDGSFLLYRPLVAVITNVEPDHLDHYGTADAVDAAFTGFAFNVQPGGTVVACADDAGVRRVLTPIANDLAVRGISISWYGTNDPPADHARYVQVQNFTPAGDGSGFTLADGTASYDVQLNAPGLHNALNAAATWITATRLGPGTPQHAAASAAALSEFGGTKRRFETKGAAAGVRVVDDYAHHPTEVAATLRAARTAAGDGRVIAIFQPHLFSRTRIFAKDFGSALAAADEIFVLDVYPAREDPEPGVTGDLIVRAVPRTGPSARFVPDQAALANLVAGVALPGDLVLTIGAGDVTDLGPDILAAIDKAAAGPAAPGTAPSTTAGDALTDRDGA